MKLSDFKKLFINNVEMKEIGVGDTMLWSAGRIPSEYQEVEWIGTDGKSYIMSNFTINNLDKFTLYYTCCLPSNSQYMFGADGNPNGSPEGVGVSAPRFLHRHGTFVYNSSATSGNILADPTPFRFDSTFHSLKFVCEHRGKVIITEGEQLHYENDFFNAKSYYPFGVFCNNYKSTPSSYLAANGSKLAEFRFVDDTTGEDAFNPVPCYRKADGVIGMYDIVSKTFFTNAGNGTFTKGADV